MTKFRALIFSLLLALVVPSSYALAQTATPTPTPTPDYRTFVQIGAIELLAGTPPDSSTGWLICDGSAVSRTTYANLFAAIGTTYGPGDGATTFNLPDLRGRVPVGSGAGTGLTARTIGQTFGEETHTLTITEMPSHNHTITDPGHTHPPATPFTSFIGNRSGGSVTFASGAIGGSASTTGSSTTGITINSTGGGAAFNQMQPSLVVNYVIWSGAVAMPTMQAITAEETIVITVVVVFPTHTPTPTPTPTLTPTTGPSPTPTPTASPTVSTDVSYSVGSQAVMMKYEVRPGDAINATLLTVIGVFLLVLLYLALKRR